MRDCKVEGASPIVSHSRWFLVRHGDVMSWRPLIGQHKSCAAQSEESIGRDCGAFRVHGDGQTADGALADIDIREETRRTEMLRAFALKASARKPVE